MATSIRNLFIATALLAAAPAFAGPSGAAAAPSGCTQRIVQYDLVGLKFTERIASTWKWQVGPDFIDTGRAVIDTVQTATADWKGRQRDSADFEEASGQCRIGDWYQGKLKGRAYGVKVRVDGTWSNAKSSGTCTQDATVSRWITGDFLRRSLTLSPLASTLGVAWTVGGPHHLDCPFVGYDAQYGETTNAHLRNANFPYPTAKLVIDKSLLIGRSRIVHLPIHVHGSSKRDAGWDDGALDTSYSLDGVATYRRVKDCTIRPNDPIAGNPCLKPA